MDILLAFMLPLFLRLAMACFVRVDKITSDAPNVIAFKDVKGAVNFQTSETVKNPRMYVLICPPDADDTVTVDGALCDDFNDPGKNSVAKIVMESLGLTDCSEIEKDTLYKHHFVFTTTNCSGLDEYYSDDRYPYFSLFFFLLHEDDSELITGTLNIEPVGRDEKTVVNVFTGHN